VASELRTNQLEATPSPRVFHVVGETEERLILNRDFENVAGYYFLVGSTSDCRFKVALFLLVGDHVGP
jgi:hypothetical protein